MTERLYYYDSYLKSFAAKPLSSTSMAGGVGVVLDETAFYPTSGGQPHDLGRLGDRDVLDVFEDEQGNVVHLLEQEIRVDQPVGQIHWDRRYDHMQQHTGQHLLSQAFLRTSRHNTVSFHLGSDYATIDLDSEMVPVSQLDLAEKLVNQVIAENRPVTSRIVLREEADELGLRKQSEREGPLRIVTIEDFDVSACGGTHVRQTAEVGGVAIRKTERVNRQLRIEFVCGHRIIQSHRADLAHLTAIARQLSVGLPEAPQRIEKQIQETKNLQRQLREKNKLLAGYLARELYAQARDFRGFKLVRHMFEEEDMDFLKLVQQALLEQGPCITLLGCRRQGQASLIFSQSESSPLDLRELIAEASRRIEGKGGGVRHLVQGGGKNPDQLEAALLAAEEKILA
ncbi:MAG: DHHA1 domain-containing protein [Terriglobia bacterium]